ncbi:hypothetical protein NIES4074_45790 [Cylindrospermum sp. NIES-4074]|nr:hypothetical protein NIES4074_45790 [Cylindrospermum sp. NIES-4074]
MMALKHLALIILLWFCVSFNLQLAADSRMYETIQITLERTGGYAGITTKTTVNTAHLDIDKANQVRQLLNSADFFNLPPNITSYLPPPDHFQYKLTVEKNSQCHTVVVNEDAVPKTLQPLIKWLRDLKD